MITRRDFIKVTAAGGALASVGRITDARAAVMPVMPDMEFALEGERKIPLIKDVDIVVVGGSSRAVAIAVSAAKKGCRVFLVAYMPYMGDDICGSFLYERTADEIPQTIMANKIFSGKQYPTPLYVKTVLENELIDNNVDFLYSSYVTNVLTDSSGRVGGVVITNRSGRQAVRSKAVIDATQTAAVAGLFNVEFTPLSNEKQEFQFTAVGNSPKQNTEIQQGADISKVEVLPLPLEFRGKRYPVKRYTISATLKDFSYASLMEVEQIARTAAWDPDQVDSSDLLWHIPSQTIRSEKAYTGMSVSVRDIPLQSFMPRDVENLWVFGPCADIPRSVAGKVMRPVPAMFLGELLGGQIAGMVKQLESGIAGQTKSDKTGQPEPAAGNVAVKQSKINAFDYGSIKEILKPLRFQHKTFIDSPAGALPVLGEYDVVVLGGGTAGAVAGLSSARHGAKTLVLEYLHGLGGLTTLGLIGRYWDGFREGFSFSIDKSVTEMAPPDHPRQLKNWEEETHSDWKQEWYRRELLKANGELWFGVIGCGALTEGNKVKGIVVATPYGRGVIRSKVVIDSSGSADIAIAAGASFDYTGKKTLAVQGAGMGKMDPGDFYVNNDWLFIDDSDILDVSRVYVQSKAKFKGSYDIVKLPQTRERRRVTGEHIVSVYDVMNHRRYPDTISYHKSSFDTHGTIIDPYFILSPPMERHTIYDADVPLRSLLPKGLDGILTTGLGASAHRDAMPVIRMQPCLQNQGYAVGYLCAVAVKEGKSVRKVDIKKIQKHLVSIGNLPERVLTDKEFKGFGTAEMKSAADNVVDNYKELEVLLTDTNRCTELIRERIRKTENPEHKIIYASILCILGDSTYAGILKDKIEQYKEWDKGWEYTGMHQFGMSLSRLDAYIMSVGNTREKPVLGAVLEKAKLLNPESYFSHFRAVAMAVEAIGSSDAVPVLAEMLSAPGVQGYHIDSYITARNQIVPDDIDVTIRNRALKELHIARALYMCGDSNGLGEIVLKRYASGLQGHYARYASEILGHF